jgi:hypothetical protein
MQIIKPLKTNQMRYTILLLLSNIFLFESCIPKEPSILSDIVGKPILNVTIRGLVTIGKDKTPLDNILVVLKRDTIVIESIRTPQSGAFEFKVNDTDTLRSYDYSIEIPTNDPVNKKVIFKDDFYSIIKDSIQIKNFIACPAGYLSLDFVDQGLTDSLNILHSEMNCFDSLDYKIKIQALNKTKGFNYYFLEGRLRGVVVLKKDNINILKTANNAIFDVKGFKNGKIVVERTETIAVKERDTTYFTFKY